MTLTPEELYEEMIDDAIEEGEIKEVFKEFFLDYALNNNGIDFDKEYKLTEELEEKFFRKLIALEVTVIEAALKNGKDWIKLPVPDFNYGDYKLIMELSKKLHINENGEEYDINEDIIKTKAFSDHLKRKGLNSYYSPEQNGYILELKK